MREAERQPYSFSTGSWYWHVNSQELLGADTQEELLAAISGKLKEGKYGS